MSNHVHLILTPSDQDGLRAALGKAHRRHTRHINMSMKWQGYLSRGRFASLAMDEAHRFTCARYVKQIRYYITRRFPPFNVVPAPEVRSAWL